MFRDPQKNKFVYIRKLVATKLIINYLSNNN